MASKVERDVRWAQENVPVLSLHGPERIRNIVERAREETAAVRFVLEAVPAVLAAVFGVQIARDAFGETTGAWQTGAAIAIVTVLLVAVGTTASRHVLRRKIRLLAGEGGPRL